MPAFARAQLKQIYYAIATGKQGLCLSSATVACVSVEVPIAQAKPVKISSALHFFPRLA
jgi:hypothetical protein